MKKIVLLGSLILASCSPDYIWHNPPQDAGTKEQEAKEQICDELGTMLCAKASTCSLIDYNDCKEKAQEIFQCKDVNILQLDLCRTEMRNMHCDNDLPVSCLNLQ